MVDGSVWLYLIEILHQTTTSQPAALPVVLLYLIEILHQTTTVAYEPCFNELLYLIEILHQTTTRRRVYRAFRGCILSKFYIKPQQRIVSLCVERCCILSKFYIKPQHSANNNVNVCVVSYRNSTSNHNTKKILDVLAQLYLIEILHQTTTLHGFRVLQSKLYLIEILHQTTTL